ncbi:MAG TPA: exodeoxyribonuclease VII small subunit [Pseudoclavibacter sp.]|nr:exodeoxyribonuclease VII small subunit [Pseudoclavibacter sp.]
MAHSVDPDINTLSYEEARDALAQVVASLEQGQPSLEESLALWERGNALADRCESWLAGAKKRLDEAMSAQSAPADEN